jgi:hypothetical protein
MPAAHRLFVAVILVAMGFAARAAAPAGRFVVSGDSKTVSDSKTGLVWQREVPSITKTWADARTWCRNNSSNLPGTGWRLPSVKEITTIVDSSVSNPAIDVAAFPNTPSVWFWTSTPWAGSSSVGGGGPAAWVVNFPNGQAASGLVGGYYRFRCVR